MPRAIFAISENAKVAPRRDFRFTSFASPHDCDFLHLKMGQRCDVEPTIDGFRSPRRNVVTGGHR